MSFYDVNFTLRVISVHQDSFVGPRFNSTREISSAQRLQSLNRRHSTSSILSVS
jgi:hypothetical protein